MLGTYGHSPSAKSFGAAVTTPLRSGPTDSDEAVANETAHKCSELTLRADRRQVYQLAEVCLFLPFLSGFCRFFVLLVLIRLRVAAILGSVLVRIRTFLPKTVRYENILRRPTRTNRRCLNSRTPACCVMPCQRAADCDITPGRPAASRRGDRSGRPGLTRLGRTAGHGTRRSAPPLARPDRRKRRRSRPHPDGGTG